MPVRALIRPVDVKKLRERLQTLPDANLEHMISAGDFADEARALAGEVLRARREPTTAAPARPSRRRPARPPAVPFRRSALAGAATFACGTLAVLWLVAAYRVPRAFGGAEHLCVLAVAAGLGVLAAWCWTHVAVWKHATTGTFALAAVGLAVHLRDTGRLLEGFAAVGVFTLALWAWYALDRDRAAYDRQR